MDVVDVKRLAKDYMRAIIFASITMWVIFGCLFGYIFTHNVWLLVGLVVSLVIGVVVAVKYLKSHKSFYKAVEQFDSV